MPTSGEPLDAASVFECYHDPIYRYVLRMVREPAEAEDLTQDTFLRAHNRLETLRDSEAIRGWLYRIATHACLDRLRGRRQWVSIESADATAPTLADDRSPSAQEMTERKETSECVQRCLDLLPDTYRAVILLREAHALSAAEIADLLGISVATVKIRLHRARKKLQKIMTCGCNVSQDHHGQPVCEPKIAHH